MLTFKRAGYAVLTSPAGTKEFDTCTCKHCNKVWFLKGTDGKMDMGGWCRQCQAPICSECSGKGCTPFEKKLEEYEAKERFIRQLNGI